MKIFAFYFVMVFTVLIFDQNSIYAQVEDVSFTISPTAEYVWWDSNAGLADDFLYGGTVGFGFGEFLELRGLFQTSRSLTTSFSSFGLDNFSNASFERQDANLTRYGGELKINLSNNTFSPYFTLGTGIQSLNPDQGNSFDQIYASAGLGLRFAITDRLNLIVEGRALGFNSDAPRHLLTASNQSEFGVDPTETNRDQSLNFGAMAGLQVYLGGRKPGELSSLDRAVLDNYKGNFKGWTLALEPSVAYVNFDANSLYRDTWMIGGYAGLDFTEYVGIRGFYFHGTNEILGIDDFDQLNMYGLEFRAKLNDGRGVNPYLILGGGYLNTLSGYQSTEPSTAAPSTAFANAGLGLDIPLGRHVLLTGGARAMATSSLDASHTGGTDVLQSHIMFNAGVKFQIGKKIKSRPEDDDFDERVSQQLWSSEDKREEYKRIQKLKKEYNEKLEQLDKDYNAAYQKRNTAQAVSILEDRKALNASLKDVERLEKLYSEKTRTDSGEYLKMTPEEFESLIDRILQGIDEKYQQNTTNTSASSDDKDALILSLMQRIERLEQKPSGRYEGRSEQRNRRSRYKNRGEESSNEPTSSNKTEDDSNLDEQQIEALKTLEKSNAEQRERLRKLEEKAKTQEAMQREIDEKNEEQKRLEKEIQQKLKAQEKLQNELDKTTKAQEERRQKNQKELEKALEKIERLEAEVKEKNRDTIN